MNITAQVIPFQFDTHEVRTLLIDGSPWFAVKDIIRSLGYARSSSPAKLTENVPDIWKGVNRIHTLGGTQKLLMLSEQGLYFFLGRSDKPSALPFQMWLAGEVLPAIRKHGHYEDAEGKMGTLIGQTIGTDGFHMLGALIKGKVVNLPTVVQRRATAKLWAQTHAAFGVRSAADIPADQLDAARNFVAAYAIEGEYLGCLEEDGARLSNDQLMHLNALALHMDWSWRIFQRHRLYEHLTGLGSQAGIEMIDHLKDGALHGGILQRQLGPQIESARHH